HRHPDRGSGAQEDEGALVGHRGVHAVGAGNCWHRARTSPRTRPAVAASPGIASTSVIHFAIDRISPSFIPRVVRAGVPMRMPDGSIGWRVSYGIMFLF